MASKAEFSPEGESTLDPDVAANMDLAWAKVSLQRLVASNERKEGADVEVLYPTPADFPANLRCGPRLWTSGIDLRCGLQL